MLKFPSNSAKDIQSSSFNAIDKKVDLYLPDGSIKNFHKDFKTITTTEFLKQACPTKVFKYSKRLMIQQVSGNKESHE